MMHIKYKLLPSSLHSIGCFTDQYVKAGICIVQASPILDINISQTQFHSLSLSEKQEIEYHGHFDNITNMWHVDFDMTRFANHSLSPNLEQRYNDKGYYIIALRDIEKGEELTINYGDFENTSETRGNNILL